MNFSHLFRNYFLEGTLYFILKDASDWIILCHGEPNVINFYLGITNEEWNSFPLQLPAFSIIQYNLSYPRLTCFKSGLSSLLLRSMNRQCHPKGHSLRNRMVVGCFWFESSSEWQPFYCVLHSRVKELKCRVLCFIIEHGEDRKNWFTIIEHLICARHGHSNPVS